MVFKKLIKVITSPFVNINTWANKVSVKKEDDSNELDSYELDESSIYEGSENEFSDEVHSVWDYLEFMENTQAFYLTKVIGFDEWVSMDEIRRRIIELFGINYKNERSLYAYIKTLVDCGLLESSNHGGKRKWRKKDLLIRIKNKKKKKELEELTSMQTS